MDFLPGCVHPIKQCLHLIGHKLGRRGHKDAASPVKDAFIVIAKNTGFLHGKVSHNAVQFLQVIQRIGIKLTKQVIGLIRILYFLDLFLRANDGLAADDAFDLIQRQGVGLDGQRGMDGTNPVVTA